MMTGTRPASVILVPYEVAVNQEKHAHEPISPSLSPQDAAGEAPERRETDLTVSASVLEGLTRLTRFLRSNLKNVDAPAALTIQQRGLLIDLRYGPLPMSKIALMRGVGRTTATDLVDRLVARGLVTKVVDPQDRRSFLASLTPQGRDHLHQGMRHSLGRISQIANLVSPQEWQHIGETMAVLGRALAAHSATDSEPSESGRNTAGPLDIPWHDEEATLDQRWREERDPRRRLRLQAILALRRGGSLPEVSQSLGIPYRTLRRWVAWYRIGGCPRLLASTRGGGRR